MSRLVERYQQGLKSPGIWLNTADSQIAEIATAADFDWVCIDLQPGDVILSGSFVRAVPFEADQSLVALFDGLGEVTLKVAP